MTREVRDLRHGLERDDALEREVGPVRDEAVEVVCVTLVVPRYERVVYEVLPPLGEERVLHRARG